MSYQPASFSEKNLTQLGTYNFVAIRDGQSNVPANLQINGTDYSLSEGDDTSRTLSASANYSVSTTTDTEGFEFGNGHYLRGSTQEFKKLI